MFGAHVQEQRVAPGVDGGTVRAGVLPREVHVIVVPGIADYFPAEDAPPPLVHRSHPLEQLGHFVALHV